MESFEEHSLDKQEEKRKARKTDETALYIIGWILLGFLALFLVVYLWLGQQAEKLFPPCLMHELLGLYCPGCGGTRALFFLLRGRILTSFLYHPFVPYGVLGGGWFMVSQTIERITRGRVAIGMRYRDGYVWAAVVLVAVNFLIKNILLLCGIDVLSMLG